VARKSCTALEQGNYQDTLYSEEYGTPQLGYSCSPRQGLKLLATNNVWKYIEADGQLTTTLILNAC
jgi:hypothetical protein